MRRAVRIVVALAALVMIGVSGWNLWLIHQDYSAGEQLYQEAADQYVQTVPPQTTAPGEPDGTGVKVDYDVLEDVAPREYAPIRVDFEALWQENQYVVGWIYCPGTVINYPIVQTENNSDFLRRGLDGKYLSAGTIFLDFRNNPDFTSDNSVIYGHNMRNNTMFGTFDRYKEAGYYEEHPVFYLLTPGADYRVDLIAGIRVNATSDDYRMDHTPESFLEFLENAVENSTFDSAVDITAVERTLTMSTCSYEYDDARYILIGSMKELDRMEE